VDKDGKRFAVKAKEGQNLVHVAHENDVELEGACECSLACSTCHVVLKPEIYSSLEPATDEEEDLLDLAFGLTAS
jgi:ferredoxin